MQKKITSYCLPMTFLIEQRPYLRLRYTTVNKEATSIRIIEDAAIPTIAGEPKPL